VLYTLAAPSFSIAILVPMTVLWRRGSIIFLRARLELPTIEIRWNPNRKNSFLGIPAASVNWSFWYWKDNEKLSTETLFALPSACRFNAQTWISKFFYPLTSSPISCGFPQKLPKPGIPALGRILCRKCLYFCRVWFTSLCDWTPAKLSHLIKTWVFPRVGFRFCTCNTFWSARFGLDMKAFMVDSFFGSY